MAVTVDDLNAVRAQWEEWTADSGFSLQVEIKDEKPPGVILSGEGLDARLQTELYLQVRIARGERVVFDQPCPYDARALRASIAVLARTIAARQDDGPGDCSS